MKNTIDLYEASAQNFITSETKAAERAERARAAALRARKEREERELTIHKLDYADAECIVIALEENGTRDAARLAKRVNKEYMQAEDKGDETCDIDVSKRELQLIMSSVEACRADGLLFGIEALQNNLQETLNTPEAKYPAHAILKRIADHINAHDETLYQETADGRAFNIVLDCMLIVETEARLRAIAKGAK